MRQEADRLVDVLCGDEDAIVAGIGSTQGGVRLAENGPLQLRMFYEKEIRPFLQERLPRRSVLANPLLTEVQFDRIGRLAGLTDSGEKLSELASLCDRRRQLAQQERLHFWLHAWLVLHIPFSAGVLVLGVFHVIVTLCW